MGRSGLTPPTAVGKSEPNMLGSCFLYGPSQGPVNPSTQPRPARDCKQEKEFTYTFPFPYNLSFKGGEWGSMTRLGSLELMGAKVKHQERMLIK